jgi:hypothetical protein
VLSRPSLPLAPHRLLRRPVSPQFMTTLTTSAPLSSQTDGVSVQTDRLVLGLLLVAIGKLWLAPLFTGFWLDETGTYWTIARSFRETYARSLAWPAQPLLYSMMLWFMRHTGLPVELALRLPSVLAMLLGVFLLYRLGSHLFGREAALLATVAFACWEPVGFAAADARSYALGLLAVVAATLLLFHWFEEQQLGQALGYAAMAALALHMNYLYGTMLVAHLVYATLRVRAGARIRISHLLLALALLGLLLLPLAAHIRAMAASRLTHSFSGTPDWRDLFSWLAAPPVLGAAGAGLLAARLLRQGRKWSWHTAASSRWQLAACLALATPLVLFAMSTLTANKAFIGRYLLPSIPGIALLAGWVMAAAPVVARRIACVVMVSVAVATTQGGFRSAAHGGDWRAAIGEVNARVGTSATPVLVRSGFVESAFVDWNSSARNTPFFFAPLDIYPMAGELTRLPYRTSEAAFEYLENLAPDLERNESFLLLTSGDPSYEFWLQGRLEEKGFIRRRVRYIGESLRVVMFQKQQAPVLDHKGD